MKQSAKKIAEIKAANARAHALVAIAAAEKAAMHTVTPPAPPPPPIKAGEAK